VFLNWNIDLIGFRGWGGFRGRNYDRNNTAAENIATNSQDEAN